VALRSEQLLLEKQLLNNIVGIHFFAIHFFLLSVGMNGAGPI
jgi:hypothetical protein